MRPCCIAAYDHGLPPRKRAASEWAGLYAAHRTRSRARCRGGQPSEERGAHRRWKRQDSRALRLFAIGIHFGCIFVSVTCALCFSYSISDRGRSRVYFCTSAFPQGLLAPFLPPRTPPPGHHAGRCDGRDSSSSLCVQSRKGDSGGDASFYQLPTAAAVDLCCHAFRPDYCIPFQSSAHVQLYSRFLDCSVSGLFFRSALRHIRRRLFRCKDRTEGVAFVSRPLVTYFQFVGDTSPFAFTVAELGESAK